MGKDMIKMKIRLLYILAASFVLSGCADRCGIGDEAVPARLPGQTHVLHLACDPVPVVRVGFIGVGTRGKGAIERYCSFDGVEIKAACDIVPRNVEWVREELAKNGLPEAALYSGSETEWKKLCGRDDIDLVYICTDWLNHTPMAVYAMQQGKHVAVEVPAAVTVDECWQLVNTAETTRRHCIMLENCCYDEFGMTTLNMAQKGVFGNVIYGEGAYIHGLNDYNFNEEFKGGYHDYWRKKFNIEHTGNPYPTHGLGPIAQIMNIHRGDRMTGLVSMSTGQFGMTEYARQRFGPNSAEARQEYKMGDMNVTLIRTEKGRMIMLQHNVANPRPYSRIHLVNGTKGFALGWPIQQIALGHTALPRPIMDSLMQEYRHPFYISEEKAASESKGIVHADYIMDHRLIHCLRNGLPLDMDVYDAAEWSAIVELSERSVREGGKPVEIPDFTRGEWNKLQGLQFAE